MKYIKLFESHSEELDTITKEIINQIFDCSDCEDRPRYNSHISDICDDILHNVDQFIEINNIRIKINEKELLNYLTNVVFKGGIGSPSSPKFLDNQWWNTEERTKMPNFPYTDKETFDEIKEVISKNS